MILSQICSFYKRENYLLDSREKGEKKEVKVLQNQKE